MSRWCLAPVAAVCLLLAIVTPVAAADLAPPTHRTLDPPPESAVARMGTARFRAGPALSGLAYSRDGKALLTASMGGTLTVWEASTGKLLRRIDTDLGMILAAALAPDGKTVAVAGPKG